nr:hypothetical protein [Variovorax sp. WS11]
MAGLLEFDDMAAHLPEGLDELGVNGLHRPHPALGVGVGDLLLHEHGIQRQAFARTRVALNRLRDTIAQHEQLPP